MCNLYVAIGFMYACGLCGIFRAKHQPESQSPLRATHRRNRRPQLFPDIQQVRQNGIHLEHHDMKLTSRQARSIASAVSGGAAVLAASLLRYLLNIPSQPLDIHSGWHVFTGWLVVYFALFSLCRAVILFFLPITQRRGPDPYTLAQAEIQAERSIQSPR